MRYRRKYTRGAYVRDLKELIKIARAPVRPRDVAWLTQGEYDHLTAYLYYYLTLQEHHGGRYGVPPQFLMDAGWIPMPHKTRPVIPPGTCRLHHGPARKRKQSTSDGPTLF